MAGLTDYTGITDETPINFPASVPQKPENMQPCENKGVTDKGIVTAAAIGRLGAIAIAILNTVNAVKMAKLHKEIADKYHALAQEARDYYNDTYKPCEKIAVAEACDAPLYKREFDDVQIGRMLVSIRSKLKDTAERTIRSTGRYHTGLMAAGIKDMVIAQAAIESTVAGMGLRYEEARQLARDDLRWQRRASILNIGRDINAAAVSYAELSAGIFGRLGVQAADGVKGAIGYYEALDNRLAPQYPTRNPLIISGPIVRTETQLQPSASMTYLRAAETAEVRKENA